MTHNSTKNHINKHQSEEEKEEEQQQQKKSTLSNSTTTNNQFCSPKFEPGVCGLASLGNTCYLNSSLQSLFALEPLSKIFLTKALNEYVNNRVEYRSYSKHSRIFIQFTALLNAVWSGEYKAVRPINFVQEFFRLEPRLGNFTQQDAQEFIRLLIDHLHEEIKVKTTIEHLFSSVTIPKLVEKPTIDEDKDSTSSSTTSNHIHNSYSPPKLRFSVTLENNTENLSERDKEHQQQLIQYIDSIHKTNVIAEKREKFRKKPKKNNNINEDISNSEIEENIPSMSIGKSIISDIFEGWLLSEVTCSNCGHVSQTVDTFYDLSLSIPDRSTRYAAQEEMKKRYTYMKTLETEDTSNSDQDNIDLNSEKSNSTSQNNIKSNDLSSDNLMEEKNSTDETCSQVSNDEQNSSQTEKGTVLDSTYNVVVGGFLGCINAIMSVGISDVFNNIIGNSYCADLSELLSSFCMPEHLVGENKYKCENCQEAHDSTKRFSLIKLPEVLCVHVKRFYFSYWGSKLSEHINFPLKDFDISPFCKTDSNLGLPPNTKYDLCSVITHHGGYSGGHYTAYIRNFANDQWYHTNDSIVTPVNEDAVKSTQAYVLFYRKKKN